MNEVTALAHWVYLHRALFKGAIALWVYASIIHKLPPPRPTERWYGAFYDFMHTVLQVFGANWDRVGQSSTGTH